MIFISFLHDFDGLFFSKNFLHILISNAQKILYLKDKALKE